MQKKKPSFQVIPNYRIGGPKTGMNLKKRLRNRAGMVLAGATSATAAGLFRSVIRDRQTGRSDLAIQAEFRPSGMRIVRRNSGGFWHHQVRTAAPFIELSSKI
jgi:hypothetical protein